MRVGIVGFGSFGKLMAELLEPHTDVLVYSRRGSTATIEEVAGCDLVLLSTELDRLRDVCEQLKPHVSPETIVSDVCSVKVKPAATLEDVLGEKCQLLASHPMFGPQSVKDNGGTKGLTWVWHELTEGDFEEVRELLTKKLQLDILPMTPDEHDKQMAWVHGLTFFVGRGLLELDIPPLTLDTGYYRRLVDLYELEKKHSKALFYTVERGNPYAKEIREKFIKSLGKLESDIEEENIRG